MMAGLFHNRMQMPFTVTVPPVKTQFRKNPQIFLNCNYIKIKIFAEDGQSETEAIPTVTAGTAA